MPRHEPSARGPRARCDCGLPPFVGVSRSAKNAGRSYANCSRWPGPLGCRYFQWLDGWAPHAEQPAAQQQAGSAHTAGQTAGSAPGPPTPPRLDGPGGPPARAPPTSLPTEAQQPRPPAAAAVAASYASTAPAPDQAHTHERFAVKLLVEAADDQPGLLSAAGAWRQGQGGQQRVRLLLLPASAHPPQFCTQSLAVPCGERRLPRAPASLLSLQPPYVALRHCPAARGLAEELGWPGGSGGGGLFVLDCETTGLGGRDYIHQLAALNLHTCQLLTLLLRTCPRAIAPLAAQNAGGSNYALHDPNRPTFGQVVALLHAFVESGSSTGGSSSSRVLATHAASPAPSSSAPLIVAHNGGFDARMLIGDWGRRGLPVPQHWRLLDTLPLAHSCVQGCANHKQGTLRLHFGVGLAPGEREHDAGTDAVVLAQLLPHIVRASGAGSLAGVAAGRVRTRQGKSFVRTFGDVQAGMKGAAGRPEAAEADTFTCGFCHARVVQ